ncbi:MAG: vitamin B12 ABC transporter permease BtuC [Halanaeroarchaeum sp.]
MHGAVRKAGWIGALGGLLLATVLLSAAVGPVHVAPATIAKIVLEAIVVPTSVEMAWAPGSVLGVAVPTIDVGFAPLVRFSIPETSRTIVLSIRLPRIALAAIVGFALAGAGAVMQGFFRNPMADPSIIGVSSGAAVGAVAAITLPLGVSLHTAAFVTGLATAFGVYVIATEGGRTPVATLLLAGVAVQTFLGAVISFMLVHSGESLQQAVFWLMGHLHNATWDDVRLSLVLVPVLFGGLLWYARDLNVLLLGEEDAQTLGVEVERTKRILLGLSSLLTATAVAVAGVIGFVGLIVPHVMRLLVGPDHRLLLPTSAIAGGAFLVATDTVARTGAAELPVGIVTAALGAPFFLYLLTRREVHAL